jgi:hypothetical protein
MKHLLDQNNKLRRFTKKIKNLLLRINLSFASVIRYTLQSSNFKNLDSTMC